jgi:hypothetical protein
MVGMFLIFFIKKSFIILFTKIDFIFKDFMLFFLNKKNENIKNVSNILYKKKYFLFIF